MTWDDWSDLDVNKAIAIANKHKVIQQSIVSIGLVWAIEGGGWWNL